MLFAQILLSERWRFPWLWGDRKETSVTVLKIRAVTSEVAETSAGGTELDGKVVSNEAEAVGELVA